MTGVVAEIDYPSGKIAMTRDDKNNIMMSNTVFCHNVKNKKRKRALVQVELPNTKDRFFEDGAILSGGDLGAGAMCKVVVVNKDDGGQEIIVSMSTTVAPPSPQAEEEKKEKKEKKDKTEKVGECSSTPEGE